MMDAPRLAWLFDIDGTILLTEGASREAFSHALHLRHGLTDNLRDIRFDGRTEPLILADIAAKHGLDFSNGEEAEFWNAVFDRMRQILKAPRGRLLPGAEALIRRVGGEPGWVMGLLTGNMTEMARIKLARFGLGEDFAFGAFGEQAENREALARIVVGKVGRDYGIPPLRCIVIGDTEHDVSCARSAGARAVAVATGTRTRAELAALEPDLLLDDLSDPAALLDFARSIEG
ncbi:MAG TPA: haloacid dehalogenase-like hydrolase [Candidatus Udaeobacter sp.]|jgi:phosphoglycolate phosphatase-like HAD superfamily hydrolase|nr:haloacid dehalogenase-like hydrolase [Candidatus Udaeobacter sp.]